MKIDSHQHFWKVGKFDYPWLSPKLGVLYSDYLPADFPRAGIDRTIVVQASPSVAETDWLLELAAQHDFIAGVVGWLDFEAPDFAAQFERYRKKPKLVGLRPAVEFISDDEWLARPSVVRSLTILADADFPVDLIVWPRHLPTVLRMLEQVPRLRCVVDHLAKPPIRERKLEPWKKLIAQVAAHPNVHCKLSGMITEADHKNWTPADLLPYIEHVVESFGLQRVMFGSDWPVCLMAGSYEQVVNALPQPMRTPAFFGDNAVRFYKLEEK